MDKTHNSLVNFDFAKDLGLDEAEWNLIVQRMGRKPNLYETIILAQMWSDHISKKSVVSLRQAIETFNYKNKPYSSINYTKINDDYEACISTCATNKIPIAFPIESIKFSASQSYDQITSTGGLPLCNGQISKIGGTEESFTPYFIQATKYSSSQIKKQSDIGVYSNNIYLDYSYAKNPLINTFTLGIRKLGTKVNVSNLTEQEKPKSSYAIIYLGNKTGLDGLIKVKKINNIEKAELQVKTTSNFNSLKINKLINELISENILHFCKNLDNSGLIGAIFELSSLSDSSLEIELDRVPLRAELKPEEILLSQSSNRFLLIIEKDKLQKLSKLCYKWSLNYYSIGSLTKNEDIVFNWNHQAIANIPKSFINNDKIEKTYQLVRFPPMLKKNLELEEKEKKLAAPKKFKRKEKDEWTEIRNSNDTVNSEKQREEEIKRLSEPSSLEDSWLDLLADPNLCSKSELNINKNLLYFDANILNLDNYSLAFSTEANSLYTSKDPYLGTVQTAAISLRKIVAAGASPLCFSYCLNYGDPTDYKDICDISEAIRAIGDISKSWELAISSEEVDLRNGINSRKIKSSTAIASVGSLSTKACPTSFQDKGDIALLIGNTKNEVSVSEYSRLVLKQVGDFIPEIRFDEEVKIRNFILNLISNNLLKSACSVDSGGIAMGLAKCCLAKDRAIGAEMFLQKTFNNNFREDIHLFSETSGRFILSCKESDEEEITRQAILSGIEVTGRGVVGGKSIKLKGAVNTEINLSTAYHLWHDALKPLLTSTTSVMIGI